MYFYSFKTLKQMKPSDVCLLLAALLTVERTGLYYCTWRNANKPLFTHLFRQCFIAHAYTLMLTLTNETTKTTTTAAVAKINVSWLVVYHVASRDIQVCCMHNRPACKSILGVHKMCQLYLKESIKTH